jgi:hypothetical protein
MRPKMETTKFIHCPGCGLKIDKNEGGLEGHDMTDDTEQSGFDFMATIVCKKSMKVFAVTLEQERL